jgi:hypothetical protein
VSLITKQAAVSLVNHELKVKPSCPKKAMDFFGRQPED